MQGQFGNFLYLLGAPALMLGAPSNSLEEISNALPMWTFSAYLF